MLIELGKFCFWKHVNSLSFSVLFTGEEPYFHPVSFSKKASSRRTKDGIWKGQTPSEQFGKAYWFLVNFPFSCSTFDQKGSRYSPPRVLWWCMDGKNGRGFAKSFQTSYCCKLQKGFQHTFIPIYTNSGWIDGFWFLICYAITTACSSRNFRPLVKIYVFSSQVCLAFTFEKLYYTLSK